MQLHVTLKIQQRREKVYSGGINGFVSGEVKCSHNLLLNFGSVRTKKKKKKSWAREFLTIKN